MPGRPHNPEQVQRCVLAVSERLRREEGLGARAATSRAFQICTSSLQKQGYLKKGTAKPTLKGKARSFVKAHDEEHLLKSLRYQRLLEEGRREKPVSALDRARFARHRAWARGEGEGRGAANRQVRGARLCEALTPLREAMERVMGKAQLLIRLCEGLQTQVRALPEVLHQAREANDLRAAQQALHSIKGLAASLGAEALAAEFRGAEQACGEGRWPADDALAALSRQGTLGAEQLLGFAHRLAQGPG